MTSRAAISRRAFLRSASLLTLAALAPRGFAVVGTDKLRQVDVCVYGGTSSGVIAAVALAKLGRSVVLVEPTRHLGGMTAGGLGWIDYGRPATIGGLTQKFFSDIRAHYAAAGVPDNGWSVEPHVAENLFERMLAEHPVEVFRETRLASVRMNGRRIRSITLDKAPVDPRGAPAAQPQERHCLTVEAAMFLDCTYEGDLLAGAHVSYRKDRESRDEYGESAAGVCDSLPASGRLTGAGRLKKNVMTPLDLDPYTRVGDSASGLVALVSDAPPVAEGRRSPVVQAYTFRLCLTKDDPIPIAAPSNYDPRRYELVSRYIDALARIGDPLEAADLYFNFGYAGRHPLPRLLKITKLTRGKTDVNNSGPVSTDFVNGGSQNYADATWVERARLWHAHEDYVRGFLYHLRTAERLPGWLRQEISPWGLPRDEFRDTGGWPPQLYIREARRMVGSFVITQQHCEKAAPRQDSVGLGSYSLDSHLCQRLVKNGRVIDEGGFYHRLAKPYPIPYGAMVPRETECENLLVTFCLSCTHVAFASARMEPPSMILGESAALAADQALREGTNVQAINLRKLRARLKAAGQCV